MFQKAGINMDKDENLKRPANLRIKANILSTITMMYTFPIFLKGYLKNLEEEDIPQVDSTHSASKLGDKVEKLWQNEKTTKHPSVWKVVIQAFGNEFMCLGAGVFIDEIILRLLRPFAIIELIKYFSQKEEKIISVNDSYMYGGLIVAISLLSSLTSQLTQKHLLLLGMKVRVACTSLVYRKSLKLSKSALKNITVGYITNLLSNDFNRVESSILFLHYLWISPLQLVIMACILYHLLGVFSIAGLLFMALMVPLQVYMGKKCSAIRVSRARKADQRIRLMGEIVTGMKGIKMYTWEQPFEKLVGDIRRLEADHIRVRNYIQGIAQFLMIVPKIAMFVAIIVFVLTGNNLTVIYVFSMISFYENLKRPLTIFFTNAISLSSEVRISFGRLKEVLLAQEIEVNSGTYTHTLVESEKTSRNIGLPYVELQEVCAKWDSSPNVALQLNRVTLKAKSGQLVGLTGPVGSGKSSILQSILNELHVESGSITVKGNVAYYAQEPWICSGNVRQNILFGHQMNLERYSEVLRVCALEKDLTILPYGEHTEVGENGVILSGGQKARVSLARTIYNNVDIYLLDDPFSAIDTNVGSHLFDNCILQFLQQKCVVLVTHQTQFLTKCNYTYLVEVGGTCKKSITSQPSFHNQVPYETMHAINKDVGMAPVYNPKEHRSPKTSKEIRNTASATASSAFVAYLKAGGSVSLILATATLFILSQLTYAASDYFIVYWLGETAMIGEEYQLSLFSRNCTYIYSSLMILLITLTIGRLLMFFTICTRVSIEIHNSMFNNIVRASIIFFHTNYSGRILNRFSKDMGIIDDTIPQSIVESAEIVLIALGSVAVISVTNPWILISAAVMAVMFYYARLIYLRTSQNVRRLEGTARSPVYGHMIETLQGLTTIRSSRSQMVFQERFDNLQDFHSPIWDLFVECSKSFGFYIDVICVLFVAIITFTMLLKDTEIFVGGVALALTQGINFLTMVQCGVLQSCELENYLTSVERVVQYIKLEPENDRKGTILPKSWPETGAIQFIALYLRYNTDEPYVLKNININIESKQKIGVIGRTGAGKSSLATALFQLVKTEGTILIDNLEVSKIPLQELRSSITIIPQDPVLFSGTIRSNLDPFSHSTDSELWNALEDVQLKTVISNLSSGLDHAVFDGGSNLSVGQRQLLCLARAIIKRNRILILDEATANVDPDTDTLIQDTIRKKFGECTVLTIAHRLNTVMDSDMVLVLEAGEAVEYDHPHRLLQNQNGIFYSMLQKTGPAMEDLLTKIARVNYMQQQSALSIKY